MRRPQPLTDTTCCLWLPLAGDNEPAVLVSNGLGGWGLRGRFPDTSGFEIDPH